MYGEQWSIMHFLLPSHGLSVKVKPCRIRNGAGLKAQRISATNL